MNRKALIQKVTFYPCFEQAISQIETARRTDTDLPFYDAAILHVREARDLNDELRSIALDLADEADELEKRVKELEGRLDARECV